MSTPKEMVINPFPLVLLTPSLLWDDLCRGQLSLNWRAVSLLPLLGPALYLAPRPVNAADY